MKILSLSIQNFLIIGEASINLNNRGLMLVQGINEDDSSANSNGAGKSSIVDAISWCLYGETARGVSGDDVVNEQVGKNCQVSIVVEDAGDVYHIIRHRRHHEHKNDLVVYKNSPTEPPLNITAGTTALTQTLVDNIVGCSHEVFVATVYSGQEQMPDLPGMTDKQLKFIVEEAAGIEQLQKASDIASFRLKSAQTEYDSVNNMLNAKRSELDRARDHRDKLINDKDLFIKQKTEEKEYVLDGIRSAQDRASLVKDILSPAKEAELAAEIDLLMSKIRDSQSEEKVELERLSAEVLKCEKTLSVANVSLTIALTDAKKAKADYETVEARVGTPCKECGKEYCEDDIADARKNAERDLKEKLLRHKEQKALKEDAEKELTIAQNRRAEFSANMTDVSALVKRSEVLRQYQNENNERKKVLDAIKSEIRHLESKIESIDRSLHENPFTNLIEEREYEVVKLDKECESLTHELDVVDKRISILNDVATVYGRAGVRAHILDTVTPFLNEKTADYLGTLTDGNIAASWSTLSKTAKGDLREKFGISVIKRNGSQTFKGLSGGEKRKVRLATAMALQDLVASRATKPIEFVLWDEIDDAIDASGLERLMTILEQKGREKGTALVISHNDLNSYLEVGITVVNKGGVSEVIDGV